MAKKSYINVVLLLLKIVIVLYAFYMLMILISNNFLKKTDGEILFFNVYQEHLIYPSAPFEGGLISKGYTERNFWREDIYYKYTVDNIDYANSRKSNVLIFPSFNYKYGDTLAIYYNILIPKCSVIFKCNAVYFLINLIPIIILFIIVKIIEKYKQHRSVN